MSIFKNIRLGLLHVAVAITFELINGILNRVMIHDMQILASVVADQWTYRREAYTVQSAHVNLERERLRTRIVSAAGAGPLTSTTASTRASIPPTWRGPRRASRAMRRGCGTWSTSSGPCPIRRCCPKRSATRFMARAGSSASISWRAGAGAA